MDFFDLTSFNEFSLTVWFLTVSQALTVWLTVLIADSELTFLSSLTFFFEDAETGRLDLIGTFSFEE